MEIKGKVHCFFEQSGTFKNEFIKLGIPAEDYDIQNNFGQTDHVVDLFQIIDDAYDGKPSLFDNITKDDLIVAFFPCIYFTGSTNPRYFTLENLNYKNFTTKEKIDYMLDRADKRNFFHKKIMTLVGVVLEKNLRMVFENPFSSSHYLHNNFFKEPDIIDNNRTKRGDFFKKPTGYWFFNCEPTHGETYQPTDPKNVKRIFDLKSHPIAGMCSEERSMISQDYARNFICDFILGKKQDLSPQPGCLF